MRILVKRVVSSVLSRSLPPVLIRLLRQDGRVEQTVSVHTLVSEQTWRMGVLAVSSFEFFTRRLWPVWVHDDGSLTLQTQQRIASMRAHWKVVPRQQSDVLAHEKLNGYALFLRLRERHPLAVKMADAWLWAPNSRYIFIDSDCLFFREPEFILNWARADDETAWFMREYEDVYSYALPPDTLHKWAGREVLSKVNTGIGLLQKGLFDWERVEKLLSAPEVSKLDASDDWYIEQTLCAVLLTYWSKGGLLPSTDYITGYDARRVGWSPHCIACHYVGPTKYDRYYYHGLCGLLLSVLQSRCGCAKRVSC